MTYCIDWAVWCWHAAVINQLEHIHIISNQSLHESKLFTMVFIIFHRAVRWRNYNHFFKHSCEMGMLGSQKLSRESAHPPALWNVITANFRVQFIATSPFSVKKPLYTFCLAPNRHVDTLRGSLANLLEHLAAKKPGKGLLGNSLKKQQKQSRRDRNMTANC